MATGTQTPARSSPPSRARRCHRGQGATGWPFGPSARAAVLPGVSPHAPHQLHPGSMGGSRPSGLQGARPRPHPGCRWPFANQAEPLVGRVPRVSRNCTKQRAQEDVGRARRVAPPQVG